MSTKTSKTAKPQKKNAKHIGQEKFSLRHAFTDKEYREIGGCLNVALNKLASLEADHAAMSKDYKARIAQQEGIRDELNNKLGNGYEMRDTECQVEYDPKRGVKTLFAMDDKKRKTPLREEPMRPSDYQVEHPALLPKPPETPAATPPNVVPMTGTPPVEPGQGLTSVATAVEQAEAGDEAKRRRADAIEVIRSEGKVSVSLIQRRLKIGYAAAVVIVDKLEAEGVIGPANGGEPRAILALPDPEPSGTPAHDTANPPPVPEKRKSTKRKPTKAEFAEQQAAKGEGDK